MTKISRRMLGLFALGGLAAPSLVRAQAAPARNMSSFAMQHWQDHF